MSNKEEDIKKDFQDYYQTTTLEDAIDTQKIYNLKYEIEKADVFSKEDVTQFIEKSLRKNSNLKSCHLILEKSLMKIMYHLTQKTKNNLGTILTNTSVNMPLFRRSSPSLTLI